MLRYARNPKYGISEISKYSTEVEQCLSVSLLELYVI
jgi:hypothetical protein